MRSIAGRKRRAMAGALIVVAALSAWWLTHPSRLDGTGSRVGVTAAVNQPVLIGVFAHPRHGSVVLRSARARVQEGSADADVRVVFCARPRSTHVLGTARTSASEACGRLPRLDGQRLARPTAEAGWAQLLLEVIPREPGQVVVDGVDVTYSSGLRRGTQASGVVATVTARS